MNEICIHNFNRKQTTLRNGRVQTQYAPYPGFRSIVDVRGGDKDGPSLFAWEGEGPPPSEARPICSHRDDVLDGQTAAMLTSALKLRSPLPAVAFSEVLTHILTTHADATGENAPKPLTPDHRGWMEVFVQRVQAWRHKFDPDSPYCAVTLDLLRRDYRKCKATAIARAELMDPQKVSRGRIEYSRNLYRRVAGSFEQATGLPAFVLTQSEREEDRPHNPETTITDDFDRADGADIGNQLTWDEFTTGSPDSTTWETVSNQASNQNAASVYARATTPLSSANHQAAISVVTFNHVGGEDLAGATARDDTSGADHYIAGLFYDGADKIRFAKYISGTLTALDSDIVEAHSLPDTIECECNGSTMFSVFNSATRHTFTDTSLSLGTYCGFFGTTGMGGAGDLVFDNFEAQDTTPEPPDVSEIVASFFRSDQCPVFDRRFIPVPY